METTVNQKAFSFGNWQGTLAQPGVWEPKKSPLESTKNSTRLFLDQYRFFNTIAESRDLSEEPSDRLTRVLISIGGFQDISQNESFRNGEIGQEYFNEVARKIIRCKQEAIDYFRLSQIDIEEIDENSLIFLSRLARFEWNKTQPTKKIIRPAYSFNTVDIEEAVIKTHLKSNITFSGPSSLNGFGAFIAEMEFIPAGRKIEVFFNTLASCKKSLS